MNARLIPLVAALAWTPVATAQDLAAQSAPVMLELYTSQGCGACPKANAVFAELGAREDVVALSFSVSYWDYLGWPDTFAQDAFVARQRAYATHLSSRGVYTPQLIIDGVDHVNGAKPDRVERAINQRLEADRSGPAIDMSWNDEELLISVSGGRDNTTSEPADIYLMMFEPGATEVQVAAGENAGQQLEVYNAVTGLERVGEWTGAPTTVRVTGDRKPCAVLVQEAGMGAVLAAATNVPT